MFDVTYLRSSSPQSSPTANKADMTSQILGCQAHLKNINVNFEVKTF